MTGAEIALKKSLKHWKENEQKLREAKQVEDNLHREKRITLVPRGVIHYGGKHCSTCYHHDRYNICPVLGNDSCNGSCFDEWQAFRAAVDYEESLTVLANLAAGIVAKIEAAIVRSKVKGDGA